MKCTSLIVYSGAQANDAKQRKPSSQAPQDNNIGMDLDCQSNTSEIASEIQYLSSFCSDVIAEASNRTPDPIRQPLGFIISTCKETGTSYRHAIYTGHIPTSAMTFRRDLTDLLTCTEPSTEDRYRLACTLAKSVFSFGCQDNSWFQPSWRCKDILFLPRENSHSSLHPFITPYFSSQRKGKERASAEGSNYNWAARNHPVSPGLAKNPNLLSLTLVLAELGLGKPLSSYTDELCTQIRGVLDDPFFEMIKITTIIATKKLKSVMGAEYAEAVDSCFTYSGVAGGEGLPPDRESQMKFYEDVIVKLEKCWKGFLLGYS